MHEYDTVLKSLLADSENTLFEQITGARQGRWLNVELPKVNQPRVDLLFKTAKTAEDLYRLIAMELQSINDWWLPVRMAEYSLAVYRLYKQFPEQYVLYVGSAPMRMPSEMAGPNHVCRYKIINIQDLEAETLLKSPFPADAVLAILARYSNKMDVIGRILTRIAKLEKPEASIALSKLGILAGLRQLGDTVRKEAQHMPILDDIMDHDLLGPVLRQGLEKGRREQAISMVRRLIIERFGPPSASTEEHLSKLSVADLEVLSIRLLHAESLTDLFAR